MSVLALTWFSHRRTTELCDGLGIDLVELSTDSRGLARYLLLTSRTLRVLRQRRPDTLLVQNPSLILAAWALVLRPWFGYRLIVDAHNEAVEPYINRSWWISRLTSWVLRTADLTIVTNAPLGKSVLRAGGRYFVLPDRIPVCPQITAMALPRGFNVALIATFAEDEPISEVLEAVRGLAINLLVTGNSRKLNPAVRASAPPNVQFMGFLPESDYWALLKAVEAVIDLTTMDNCLVCGAYEAVALGKPALLSDNAACRDLFGPCAVFAQADVESIKTGLLTLTDAHSRLSQAIPSHRTAMQNEWAASAAKLRTLL